MIVVLTDRRQARRSLVEVVESAFAGGAAYVVLREKDLPPDERAALAAALRAVVGAGLIVAGPDPLGGDAVHLAAAGPYPPPELALVGRSCHDAVELSRITTEQYAVVSPVYPTPSKPGYGPPLGIDGLAKLVARSPVPVLALGGITPANAAACVAAGAAGVAVMGAVMRAEDPAAVVRDLRGATESVEALAERGGVGL
ncbi:thiamine phosphate synthase [Phytohabitans rumicis]|uniref:thiamine phosphate synthase n=1 Tax=Phytohabitans rumicis TaxID=1076125 RepID=UPI0031ED3B0C